MKNLIVAGIVLILLLLSLAISKKNKQFSDRYLILYLCFAALMQTYFYIETISVFRHSYWMLLGRGVYLLHAPLFFIYVYALLTPKKISFPLALVLFLPFVIYVAHFFYFYFWVFDEVSLSIQGGLLAVNGKISISWTAFSILFLLIEPAYLTWYYVLLSRYKKRLFNTVSSTDNIQLRWLYLLFYLWFINTILLVPISTLSVGIAWIPVKLLQIMIQATSAAFFFILGYYGLKQTNIFTNLKSDHASSNETKKNGYQKSGLSVAQAKEYHRQLLSVMENQKLYLNGELKAAELAQWLGISVNHLSQVLSQIQRQNFFDFINTYRVKDVIRKMEDTKNGHLTLLAMALDSGFNSKTSFNNVFKKITRQTPSGYYKSIKEKLPE